MIARFQFGENWTRFLSVVDEDRIAQAAARLSEMPRSPCMLTAFGIEPRQPHRAALLCTLRQQLKLQPLKHGRQAHLSKERRYLKPENFELASSKYWGPSYQQCLGQHLWYTLTDCWRK